MTEARLRRLVHTWAGRLGLEKWRILVEIEAHDDGTCSASTHRSRTYDAATIVFQPWIVGRQPPPTDWPGRAWTSDDEIERTVVHELLHCCLRDCREAALGPVDGQIHRDAFNVFEAGWRYAEEQVVDRLANALVDAWAAGPSGRGR